MTSEPKQQSEPRDEEGPELDSPSMREEVAADMKAAVVPVKTAFKADVGRVASFFRDIQSGYLKIGLLALGLTACLGVGIALSHGFRDWYMHLGMYLVIGAFVLLYVRAHLRRLWLLKWIWGLVALGLFGFFSWILVDLIPERLEVVSGVRPAVETRAKAGALMWPASLLVVHASWLALHLLFVGRFAFLGKR